MKKPSGRPRKPAKVKAAMAGALEEREEWAQEMPVVVYQTTRGALSVFATQRRGLML
jgi:hypothetical protein